MTFMQHYDGSGAIYTRRVRSHDSRHFKCTFNSALKNSGINKIGMIVRFVASMLIIIEFISTINLLILERRSEVATSLHR